MKKIILPLFIVFILFQGCATLSIVKNEYELVPASSFSVENDTTKTKMIIFNSSNSFLYGLDGSGIISIFINKKGFTKIGIGEYIQLYIPKGIYQFNLEHSDVLVFKSNHSINAFSDITIVEINSTMISNEAKLISELPVDFFNEYRPHSLTRIPMIMQVETKHN